MPCLLKFPQLQKIKCLGSEDLIRTPGLWLAQSTAAMHARFTSNCDANAGIAGAAGGSFLLDEWYHVAYTLSDSEKSLDIYVNGKRRDAYSFSQTQKVLFNDAPLHIGRAFSWKSINGDVRYDLSW